MYVDRGGRASNQFSDATNSGCFDHCSFFLFKLELTPLEGDGKGLFHEFQYIYLSGKTWVSMAARTSSHFCRKTSSSFPGCFDLTCEDIQIESLQEVRR